MRYLLVAVAAMALAVPTFAGQNPSSAAFVTFNPSVETGGPWVHTTDFTVQGIYDFYICFECIYGGMRSVSLSCTLTNVSCYFEPDYTVFHSTGHGEGGPDQDSWVISADVCVYPDEYGFVTLVKVPVYVMTEGATITLGPHPVDGQRVVDCNFDADPFCVCSNGLIGWGYPPPTNQPCECGWPCEYVSPVEPGTWGSVKALYR